MAQSRRPAASVPDRPLTLGAWLEHAERLYARAGAALGQVAASAHDEALYLLLWTLGLPLESGPEVLERAVDSGEVRKIDAVLRRRLVDRVPAAYLTREAWLGGRRFYVDERAIIPRSYFVEIIPRLRGEPRRIADVCTGTGCLGILLAHRFPKAKVDLIDISPKTLEVTAINLRLHKLGSRVRAWRSDVFDAVPPVRYDWIISNPPYEPTALMAGLPPEFRREPALALDGGLDGMDVIRKLLRESSSRLAPRGRLLIEVGGLRRAIDREFQALRPRWLETADGSNCVCEFQAAYLARSYSA